MTFWGSQVACLQRNQINRPRWDCGSLPSCSRAPPPMPIEPGDFARDPKSRAALYALPSATFDSG